MKKSPNQIRRLFTLCFLILLFGSANSFAQELTGKITDSSNQPIPGATIMLQGNAEVGTITDMDGVYILQLPDADNDVIVVSFIGMESQTIPVAGKSTIDVEMKDSYTSLDEVVAIGYGTVKKKDLTGAVASISNEKLKQNPVSNVAEALQGQLPGVSIATQDGRPGAEVNIRIRGGGSITQSNDPLIVIDGLPGGTLSDIPADQIESIDVLKDASSTAIYGARGANGVILVTTKGLNTKKGKVNVSYSGYYQMKQLTNTTQTLSAQDYILHQWSYGTAYNDQSRKAVEGYFIYDEDGNNRYADYANVNAHNYTDDLLRDAFQQDHNISISSNTDKTIFAFSANLNEDKGIKIQSGYKRQNMNMQIQQELAENLKIGFNIRYVQTRTEGRESTSSGRGSILSSAYMFNPIDNPLGTGDFSEYDGWGNGDVNLDPTYDPYKRTMDINDITYRQKYNGFVYLNWEIIKGLNARYEIAGNRNYSEGQFYDNGTSVANKNARLNLSRGEGWRSSATLNYEVQGLDQHTLSFLAGTDAQYSKTDNSRMEGTGYPEFYDFERTMGMIDDVHYYDVISVKDPADDTQEIASINQITKQNFGFSNTIGVASTTLSYFGRVNYSFKERYLLQASIRADGSSKFAPNNRWGYFPAASAGWRVSDEPFMEGASNWLDNLKLRLSYGTAGMDRIPYFAWNDLFDVSYNDNGEKLTIPKGYRPNEDLRWETTVSRNLGLDFNVLNNSLALTVDAYSNYTKDLLGEVPLDPGVTGYSAEYQNIGQTSNQGIEIGVSANLIRNNDFTLSISGTYNYNVNKVDKLDPGLLTDYSSNWSGSLHEPDTEFLFREGQPVGLIRAYVSDGYYTPEDFDYTVDEATGDYTYMLKEGIPYYNTAITNNYPSPFRGKVKREEVRVDDDGNPVLDGDGNQIIDIIDLTDIFPGALKMQDVNGDGVITKDDVKELGQMAPKHTGGFALNAAYKGFDFNANFAYALGGKVLNVNRALNTFGAKDNTMGAQRMSSHGDSYKVYDIDSEGNLFPVTDPAGLNALNANATTHLPYYEQAVLLDDFVEDASYLRLNSLTLGYTLPQDLTQKVSIERVRFYVTGGNLFVLSNYSGLDPDVNTKSTSGSYPTPGLDYGAYPRARTFTFGLNVNF